MRAPGQEPIGEGDYNAEKKDLQKSTGTVKWFNGAQGFGFIAQDGGGPDIFVHYSAIAGAGFRGLEENQRVEFEVKQGQEGLQAENVRPV
jgi:cold shock protein